ncbi:MAG: hypothetical protein Q8O92_10035 [Candidatus Latescibacter sp.]|nr:hypothetical protein [Candidatus Latescibacter sp.]
MLAAHKEVFMETAKWLGCSEKKFPFPATLLSQKTADAASGSAEKA